MQSAGRGNIMGMVLEKQSLLLTLMESSVRVNVFNSRTDELPDKDVVPASLP